VRTDQQETETTDVNHPPKNPEVLMNFPDENAFRAIVTDEALRLGIQNILGEKPPKGKMERFFSHPLTNTLLQFMLTGLIGLGIATFVQNRTEAQKRNAELRETRRSGAERVFRDVSGSMDRRLYWSRQYQGALASRNQRDVRAARTRLDSTMTEWNTNLNTNTAMVCIYYGPKISDYFSKQVSPTMDLYEEQLKLKSSDPHSSSEDLDTIYLHLQQAIFALDLRLADRIRSGELWDETASTGQCKIPLQFTQLLPVRAGTPQE
jgi:hypothetical protein